MDKQPDFGSLFAADMDPVRVRFTAGGRDCWMDFRPMDADEMARFEALTRKGMDDPDNYLAARHFIRARTVVGWQIWQRNGETWQESVAPEDVSQRRALLAGGWQLAPDFAAWIDEQCLVVNKLLEADEGNSTAPAQP